MQMALLEDCIEQVPDPDLRHLIRGEIRNLKNSKKFGLVFEEHLPEVMPLYSVPIKKGMRVALRSGPLSLTWRVRLSHEGQIEAVSEADGTRQLFQAEDLVAVKKFGEAVYPSLVPVDRIDRDSDKACHVLIEADNYHALQLLDYLYSGQVDCIYIDPPYNTGAKDWKYNNNYVDTNDGYRYSKWLSFMKKRLLLAFRLLKETGVICITIDDYEMHHLRLLLEDTLPSAPVLGVVAIRNNPSGRSTVTGFSVCHEYAIFLGKSSSAVIGRQPRTGEQWARFNEEDADGPFNWLNFRKDGGAVTYRAARPKQFYPLYISHETIRIPTMLWQEGTRAWRILEEPQENEYVLWPLDSKGRDRVWSFGHETARDRLKDFEVRWSSDEIPSVFRKNRPSKDGVLPRTWWDKRQYSAREYGTSALTNLFGESNAFPFAKSPYAVRDCLWIAGAFRPNALIVDFFAGSGTTLQACAELNELDGGDRRCILVTNNEVKFEEAQKLAARGLTKGSDEYEQHGICRSITFPRCKYVLNGCRDDGTELFGDYLTGRTLPKIVPRKVRPLPFADLESLRDVKTRRAFAAVLGISQNKVDASAWYLHEGETTTILWDPLQLGPYCAALEKFGATAEVVLVALPDNRAFKEAKSYILAALPPLYKDQDETRLLALGFAQNLQYFRLEFLDPLNVEMGRELASLMPILWMMAGAKGPLPRLLDTEAYIIAESASLAILLNETHFAEFRNRLHKCEGISHVFIVSDNADSFHAMRAELANLHVVQLYSNYLNNFRINTDERSL
jgi:adenine-specific DNA-methyltransferase